MKKVLLSLLAVILVLAALAAAGLTGYRYGYAQGVLSASDGESQLVIPGFGFEWRRMPMHPFGFDRGFDRGFGPGGYHMMGGGGMGFGFFSPILFLLRIAFWGLVIWAIYMLVTRSGWRLTRTTTVSEPEPGPVESQPKE